MSCDSHGMRPKDGLIVDSVHTGNWAKELARPCNMSLLRRCISGGLLGVGQSVCSHKAIRRKLNGKRRPEHIIRNVGLIPDFSRTPYLQSTLERAHMLRLEDGDSVSEAERGPKSSPLNGANNHRGETRQERCDASITSLLFHALRLAVNLTGSVHYAARAAYIRWLTTPLSVDTCKVNILRNYSHASCVIKQRL